MSEKQPPAPAVYPASRDNAPGDETLADDAAAAEAVKTEVTVPREIGGRDGPEPTRFGDWEKNGRCIDF